MEIHGFGAEYVNVDALQNPNTSLVSDVYEFLHNSEGKNNLFYYNYSLLVLSITMHTEHSFFLKS